MAAARSCRSGKSETSRARVAGKISAAPTPIAARPAIRPMVPVAKDPGRTLRLAAGDFLLLEEIAGASTALPPMPMRHRHVVRLTEVTPATDPIDAAEIIEVSWAPADALPFPLCLDAMSRTPPHPVTMAVAPATSSCSPSAAAGLPLILKAADGADPRIDRPDPRSPRRRRLPLAPAALRRVADIRQRLRPGRIRHRRACAGPASPLWPPSPWSTRTVTGRSERDLLASGRFEQDLVVDESDGHVRLRFGDGVNGIPPRPRAQVEPPPAPTGKSWPASAAAPPPAISAQKPRSGCHRGPVSCSSRDPLPAVSAPDPESPAQVPHLRPRGFPRPDAAVTLRDVYALVAERHPRSPVPAPSCSGPSGCDLPTSSSTSTGAAAARSKPDPAPSSPAISLAQPWSRFRLDGPRPGNQQAGPRAAADRAVRVRHAAHRPHRTRSRLRRGLGSRVLDDGSPAFFNPDQLDLGQALRTFRR